MGSMYRRTLLKLTGASLAAAAIGGRWMPRPASAAPPSNVPAVAGAGESKTISEQIADFIVGARFEDLPTTVIQKAKEQIAFYFGRAFEGSCGNEARQIREVAAQGGLSPGGAVVIGERVRLTPSDAAFANTTLMRGSFGMDDVIWPAGIHAGVITLPIALAFGEVQRVSGRELLLALVLGYEVLGKLGRAAEGWSAPMPRRPTNIYGSYGPIAVAGRLLKLDQQHMAHALGYAANMNIGIPEGGMTDHYYSLISRNGAFAAQLAEAGGAAYSRTTIEGELGLYRSFFGKVPAELPALMGSLGLDWEILTAEQKRHPGTGQNTTAIEILQDLIKEHRLTAGQVDTIEVVQPDAKEAPVRKNAVASKGPFKTQVDAVSSLPYALALLLQFDGRIDLKWYSDGASQRVINDRAIAALMQKIVLIYEGGHGPRYCRMAVRTTDGRTFERVVENFEYRFPQAMWGNWLQERGELLLPLENLRRLEQLIGDLEKLDDVSKLMATVTPPGSPQCR